MSKHCTHTMRKGTGWPSAICMYTVIGVDCLDKTAQSQSLGTGHGTGCGSLEYWLVSWLVCLDVKHISMQLYYLCVLSWLANSLMFVLQLKVVLSWILRFRSQPNLEVHNTSQFMKSQHTNIWTRLVDLLFYLNETSSLPDTVWYWNIIQKQMFSLFPVPQPL